MIGRYRLRTAASVVGVVTALLAGTLTAGPARAAATGEATAPAAAAAKPIATFTLSPSAKGAAAQQLPVISCYPSISNPFQISPGGGLPALVGINALVFCNGTTSSVNMALQLYMYTGSSQFPWGFDQDGGPGRNAASAAVTSQCLPAAFQGRAQFTLVPPPGYLPPSSSFPLSSGYINFDCV
jgi:hypothetical protein